MRLILIKPVLHIGLFQFIQNITLVGAAFLLASTIITGVTTKISHVNYIQAPQFEFLNSFCNEK